MKRLLLAPLLVLTLAACGGGNVAASDETVAATSAAETFCDSVAAASSTDLTPGTSEFRNAVNDAASAVSADWDAFRDLVTSTCPDVLAAREEERADLLAAEAEAEQRDRADREARSKKAAALHAVPAPAAATPEEVAPEVPDVDAVDPAAAGTDQAARCQYLADWLDQGQGWTEGPHSGQLAPEWVAHEFYDNCLD